MNKKEFLFMCGAPRSGTSYLARLFGAHPKIVMGNERFKLLYGSGKVSPNHFTEDRFFSIREGETNVAEETCLPKKSAMEEKFPACHYVGDKYPAIIKRIGRIAQVFPEARYLFVLRNPILVARSWQVRADSPEDRWPSENGFEQALEFWEESLRKFSAAKKRGIAIRAVDYDQLVSAGEEIATGHLRETFAWLNLDVDEVFADRLLLTRRINSDPQYTEGELLALQALLAGDSWKMFHRSARNDIAQPVWSLS